MLRRAQRIAAPLLLCTPHGRAFPSYKPPTRPNQPVTTKTPAKNHRSLVGKTAAGETSGVGSNVDLDNIAFQDPESARANFSRVVARLSPVLAGALAGLLAESPDPDSALMLFDRLVSEASPEVVRLL